MLVQIVAAAALAAANPAARDRCASVPLPAGAVCVTTANGIVIAPDRAQADATARYAEAGERRFERYFGGTVPSYAVLLGRSTHGARDAVGAAGFEVTLAWMTEAESAEASREAIRGAIERRLREEGVAEADIPARIQAMQSGGIAVSSAVSGSADVIPHELGHQWFVKRYWPQFDGTVRHYGGPAPDWLDEAAALMMETDETAALKRSMYRGAWDNFPEFRDLNALLAMDHPMKGAVVPGARSGAGAIAVSTTYRVQAGGPRPVSPGARFYSQSRSVADFLIARSGNQRILDELSRALAGGQTMQQWLEANGGRYNLATAPEALQAQWAEWVATLPPPPPSPVGTAPH